MDPNKTLDSAEESADAAGHGEHLVPYHVFVNVWLALVGLTVITVGASYLDLKQMTLFTAMLIASVKVSLVIMYFMHVRYDSKVISYFLIACLVTYAIFVALTFADYSFR